MQTEKNKMMNSTEENNRPKNPENQTQKEENLENITENILKADADPKGTTEGENNPETITENLRDAPNNLVGKDSDKGENVQTKDEPSKLSEFNDEGGEKLETSNQPETKNASSNNPEAITEELKNEADNLVVKDSDKGENFQTKNESSKISEVIDEGAEKIEASNQPETKNASSNNPEAITEDLKNEADNLVGKDSGENEKIQTELTKESSSNLSATSKSETVQKETTDSDRNNPEAIAKELKNKPDNLTSHTSETDRKRANDNTDKGPENHNKNAEETALDFSQPIPESKQSQKSGMEHNDNKTAGDLNQNTDQEESIEPSSTAAAIIKEKEKTNDNDAHVKEIEDSNAEDAEDSGNEERHTIESKDYSKMSMPELNKEFEKLLKSQKIQTIKSQVNDIRSEFKSQFDALIDEKKEEFLADGGNEIDFYYSSSDKKQFNTLYKEYKQKLQAYYKELESNLKQNLEKRNAIIEEIKGLINVEENINTTYKQFKDLQEQWRNAGPIPRDRYNNTWNTYHHHVEIFYDFLHLNRDLRDLDFKHNLEQKQKIIERTEELAEDDNINRSFRELQVLHKMWKEDLGPVAKEQREEIWERFSTATKKIHDKRQAYYQDLDKSYEANLERKEEIIAAIETVAKGDAKSHQAWQKMIKKVEALRQDFFNAGKVPKKANEPTWQKFKSVVRSFNKKKNAYYKNLKQEQYKNLEKKLELIKIAEDNMKSEDFESVTPLMKKIQSDWKNIGHVPRKDSDKIWKQFKNACNEYFDRLHNKRKEENKELYEAFDKKTELLNSLKTLKLSGKPKEDNTLIQAQITTWNDLGEVPQNKRYIEGKFNRAINDLFDKLKMDKQDIEMIKYENKLENLSQPEGTGLLDNEQNFIRKKIDELKGEINQLENNMQFFSNASEDNPLFKEVHNNIEKHKADLQLWEDKLQKLRKMY